MEITKDEYKHLIANECKLNLLKVFIEQEDREAEKDGYKHASLDTSFMRKLLGMDDYVEKTVRDISYM